MRSQVARRVGAEDLDESGRNGERIEGAGDPRVILVAVEVDVEQLLPGVAGNRS